MNTWTVVRGDLGIARFDRSLPVVAGFLLFFLVTGTMLAYFWQAEVTEAVGLFFGRIIEAVVVVAFVIGYQGLPSEVDGDTIQLWLTGSITRGEYLVGKTISRSVLTTISVFVPVVIDTALIWWLWGELPVSAYLPVAMGGIIGGIVLTGFILGTGLAIRNRGYTVGVAAAVLFLVWSEQHFFAFPDDLYHLLGNPVTFPTDFTPTYAFLERLNPQYSLSLVTDHLLTRQTFDPSGPALIGVEQTPVWLQHWTAPIFVILWFAIPLMVGYTRLKMADL